MRTGVRKRTVSVCHRPPADAYPSPKPGRDPHCQAVSGNIQGDDRAGRDHRPGTEFDSTDDRCIRPDARTASDVRRDYFPVARRCSRVAVVRKRDARPYEDVVLEPHASKDRDVVLNLAAVADDYFGVDIDAKADRALRADPAPRPDVGSVPDPRSFANGDTILDDGGWMYSRALMTSRQFTLIASMRIWQDG